MGKHRLKYFASAEHRREGGWYLGTGCGEWYHEECVPIPKQVWRKKQSMSGIVIWEFTAQPRLLLVIRTCHMRMLKYFRNILYAYFE